MRSAGARAHTLLDDVRDPRASETTRLLYTFVLGSRRFEEHSGLRAEIETMSLLETLDVPLLSAAGREIVLAHHSAIYTARPSLPPEGTYSLKSVIYCTMCFFNIIFHF